MKGFVKIFPSATLQVGKVVILIIMNGLHSQDCLRGIIQYMAHVTCVGFTVQQYRNSHAGLDGARTF